MLKNAARAGLTATAAGAYLYATDEGTRRSTQFWREVFPIYVSYRFNQWRIENVAARTLLGELSPAEQKESWEALHNKYAPEAKRITLELRGFYLKNAQLMSVLSDDFVPPQYMSWMVEMQDAAPTPFAPGEAREVVERSLGASVDEIFEPGSWEDEPCGCASIGQCHRAVLRDGRNVAVKVMAPGIEQRFRSDLKTTIRFCQLAMPQHVSPLQEIEKQFLTEFDYVLEAQNLRLVHNNVMPKWGHAVCVPQPIEQLCTPDVLVMEHVPGIKLVDGIRASWERFAERQGTTLEKLEAEHKAEVERGGAKEMTLEEKAAQEKQMSRLLAMRAAALNVVRFAYNWSFGFLPGVMTLPYVDAKAESAVNLAEVLELALSVHAHEIFVDGAFNGDPHPGNILMMPDGRLGLIDYGQVKKIPVESRIVYAQLIIAINNGDATETLRISREEMGNVAKYGKQDVGYRLTCFYHDRQTQDVLQGLNIQEFIDWCEAEDPLEFVAPDYVMPARVSLMMRGLANAFGITMHTTDYWRPFAEALLDQHGVTYKRKDGTLANAASST